MRTGAENKGEETKKEGMEGEEPKTGDWGEEIIFKVHQMKNSPLEQQGPYSFTNKTQDH